VRLFIRLSGILITIFYLNLGYSAHLDKIEENIGDSVITTKVTAKFTKDSTINPFKIKVSTRHGRVTLKGFVANKAAFVTALRLTKSTKGVRSVNAELLEIKPANTTFSDAYITAKVETAILKAKVLDDESIPLVGINVKTKNGIVTLSGKVKSRQSMNAILKRVHLIHGVKKIISKLNIS
jgi:hyperosmotically inducible protein